MRNAAAVIAVLSILSVAADDPTPGPTFEPTEEPTPDPTETETPPPEDPRPNIVLIYTDDQRWDSLNAMQTVQSELQAKGTTFTNAHVVNPVCCPSRASLLTGQYSHSTGVWSNNLPYGGFTVFDDSETLPTALDGAGYRTGLVGKYLNGANQPYLPPGWDEYAQIKSGTGGGLLQLHPLRRRRDERRG